MYSFLRDKDIPRNNNTRPGTWQEAVRALRSEMATHPKIMSSAHLFGLEINIIDWQGVGQNDSAILFAIISVDSDILSLHECVNPK